MPNSIKRLNYHRGLFLEETEFILEQQYHILMRRRLNYALFEAGILRGLELEYNGSNSVTVKPGVAVSRDNSTMEGKEILVPEHILSLSGNTAIPNADVLIVLSYDEETRAADIKDPTHTPALVTEIARTEAVLQSTFTPDPDVRIVLGRITVGSPLAGPIPQRQIVRIRSELLPTPTLTPGIVIPLATVSTGTSASLTVVATGGFDLTGVTESGVSISGTGISNRQVLNNNGTQMQVTFDVAPEAPLGSRTLTVAQGTVTVSATFTISPGFTLTSFTGVNVPGDIIQVIFEGTGFSAPATVEFSIPAPGTFAPPVTVIGGDVTPTEIRVAMTSIPGNVIPGPVRISVPVNQQITSNFNFVPPAIITGLNTTSISTGQTLTINGSRFDNLPVSVGFSPYTSGATRGPDSTPPFPTAGESVTGTGDQIRVLIPLGAAGNTGKVRVTTAVGIRQSIVQSDVDLTVT